MAVYTTPSETHEHYIERDTGSGAGIWAIVAVLIVLFAFLFFGTNVFGHRGGTTGTVNNNSGSSIQTPGTSSSSSGTSGSATGSASGSASGSVTK